MGDEVIIRCPTCGDHRTHNHCYVNPEKGVWHCHYCGRSGTVRELSKDHGDLKEVVDLLRMTTRAASAAKQHPAFLRATLPVILPETAWAMDYLRKRGLTTAEMVRFRTCVSPTVPNRVIFPEYVGQNISFWSARSVANDRPKWLFPKAGETSKTKSESVWGLDALEKGSEIWVTEGVFDAIAVKGVCIYGKVPSNIQLQLLLLKEPSKVVVALDRDAQDEAESVKRRLRGTADVDIQFSKAKDYGSYLQAGYRRVEGTERFRKEIVND